MGETPRWREDFPVRWELDDYVTRRELTKFLVLGSGLLAGANAALAIAGKLQETPKAPRTKIARASSIAAGSSLLFRYPTAEDPCILLRARDGSLEAYSQVCTHLSCAVVHRPEDETLYCPCHHGEDVFAVGVEV
jgi:Rieske Fe-S protein